MSVPWLGQLRAPRAAADVAVTIGADAESVRSRLGDQALRWADSVACEAAASIGEKIPDLGSNAAHLRLVRRGIVSTVLRDLLIVDGDDVDSVTDEARMAVRDFARRGVPLPGVLRAARIGHTVIIEHFLQAAATQVPAATTEMRRVLRLLLGQFDLFVTDIEAEFRDEYENGLAATAATRIETINKVLANTLDDEVASSELRYPLHSTHVGVVAWSNGEPSPVTDATVRQATSALLSAFGTYHNLLVPVGAGAVWAWGTLPGTQLDMSSIPPMPSDIDIAVGQPAAGMAGFCASHLEARAVERLLLLSAHPAGGGVTYHHDTALAILMAADLNAARVFLRRTLGQLVEDDPRMSETRATLRAYLDEGRSLAKAAQRLQIARNTVTYRIHRAEELSGTSLSTHHLLMHAALVLHDYIDIGGG